MSKRGMTEKRADEREIVLERAMVTRHYVFTWDLDRCVGCQIGPLVCPKEAVIHVEGQIVDASGRETWGEIGCGQVIGPDGRLAQVVHILRDVTERKEIDLLKDEFLATASHELRTPLSHIKGFATTLLQTDVDWDEASQRDFLGSINRPAGFFYTRRHFECCRCCRGIAFLSTQKQEQCYGRFV